MIKWLFLLILLTGLGTWAIVEKESKEKEVDGVSVPWSIDLIKQANKLTLNDEKLKLVFLRHPTGYWWLLEPEKGMANQLNVGLWFNLLVMPKIMRWMDPTESQREQLQHAVWAEFEINESSKIKVAYFENAQRSDVNYLYLPQSDRILVLEAEAKPEKNLDIGNYRTIRIFPFTPYAATKMCYQVGDRKFTFQKHEKGWQIDFAMNEKWTFILKHLYNAPSQGVVLSREQEEVLASWEFDFESGDRAKLELMLGKQGYVAFYRGREMGQIIGVEEVKSYFPGVIDPIE